MADKSTPAIVVKEKGKSISYCGKNAEKNKQKVDQKKTVEKEVVTNG